MRISESALDYLEQQIPEMAALATRQAYWQTLSSGDSVLIAESGQLVEIFPDGRRQLIKSLPETTQVSLGQKFTLK